MPKTTQQFQEIKDKRIEQISTIALKLFCEFGYEAVSIDDICNKAKISHGLFYHYFSSKKDVQNAIFQNGKDKMKSLIEVFDSRSLKGVNMLTQLNSNILNILRTDPTTSYYIYYLLANGFMFFTDEENKKKYGKIIKKIIQAIKDGQKKREVVAGEPIQICYAYFSLIFGVTSLNNKYNKSKHQCVPDDDVVMNLFLRKKEI